MPRMIPAPLADWWKALNERFLPDYVSSADRLTQWRERVLLYVVILTAFIGPVALVPSVALAVVEARWGVVVIDLVGYGVALSVLLGYRRWPLTVRAWVVCLVVFLLGTSLLFMLGPYGAGYIWLFASSVLAGGFIGLAAGGLSLLLNFLTLMLVAAGIFFGWLDWPSLGGNPLRQWLVMVVNFMLINTLITITTSLMLSGLRTALENEQSVSASLRQSESRYRSLSNNFPNGVLFLLDSDLRCLAAGGNGLASLGLSGQQVPGRALVELFPELNELITQHLHQALQGEESQFEFKYQGRTFANQVLPILHDDATHTQVIVVTQDITERKEAEERLQASEHRFRSFVENAHDIVYALTPQGRFTYVSPNWQEFMGDPPDQAVGKSFVPYVHPEDRAACWDFLDRVLTSGQKLDGVEYRVFHRDGSERWHVSTGSALRDEQGKVVSYVGIARDVTERKRFEREKAALESQLNQARKMEAVGTLAGGIAHDFNNILTAISGFSELALDAARQGEATPEELEQIFHAADRARELVRKILIFSRKAAHNPRPLNLNQVVNDAVSILSHTLPKMIAVELNLAADLWPTNCDPTQLEQVVINLANNARDAMPQGGRLIVETQNITLDQEDAATHLDTPPGPYVQLTVSDTGMGMDAETLEHIFEPFYTTKEVGKGTGLGLASVYGIVKSHGGRTTCYSEPGNGTTFRIFLPALEPGPDQEQASPGQLDARPGGKETVLLVDDEESLRGIASSMLKKKGYQVLTAASGEEALELYRTQGSRLDLVVMDLGMPGMGGLSCLRQILALNPKAKVLIASGYSATGPVKEALEAGGAGYVPKPFRWAELLSSIRRVLDGN